LKQKYFFFSLHNNILKKLSMSNLKNKNVIVIGGSSGIGLAVATLAYEYGANVTLTSRDLSKAKSKAETISSNVKFAALDVNNENNIIDFFKTFEAIDHIYIAAGSTKLGAVNEGTIEDNMKFFNERVLGSLRVVKAVNNKINLNGSITFTGGVSTDRPIAGAWVSGLGTASAEQLARVLVMEFPLIRFNAVSPGYTDTPMWDSIMGENKSTVLASVAQSLPLKKIASAEEVASAVLFLMSNNAITGEVLHVDCGGRLI
jgi:NAD(P)-dependent dehydrogenase (short-subunit alcohol dehydrogenase family)